MGRLALLASLSWLIGLTKPLFELLGFVVSWRDIILGAGGPPGKPPPKGWAKTARLRHQPPVLGRGGGCATALTAREKRERDTLAALASNGAFEGRGLGCIRGERPVFAALDFRLEPGGALVLTGPNGSGKSSLLRLMAGLLPAAAGTLAWNGSPVDDAPELHRQRMHYLGHHDALKPALTVAENLGFWASLRGANDDGVAAALARVGLDHLSGTPGHLLSAGQRRRLSLARVLAAPAPLWLLDEPSVGLDAASVRTLAEVIAEHRANGGLVAVATHQALDLPDAAHLAVDDYPPARPDPEDVW